MARYLTLINGRLHEVIPINASGGAADAGKLIETSSNGYIDPSLLPPGVFDAQSLPSSEALSAGDFVNVFDDSGTVKMRKADATVVGKEADGFVLDAVPAGQAGTIYYEGINTGLTGLTLGSRQYLSDSTAGKPTETPVTASGAVNQYLGRAISATEISFEPSEGVIRA